jgi:hypothetical protein
MESLEVAWDLFSIAILVYLIVICTSFLKVKPSIGLDAKKCTYLNQIKIYTSFSDMLLLKVVVIIPDEKAYK